MRATQNQQTRIMSENTEKKAGGSDGEEHADLVYVHEDILESAAKEAISEQAVDDGAYDKILANTPDIVRDLMKDVLAEKYANDLEEDDGDVVAALEPSAGGSGLGGGSALSRSMSQPIINDVAYPSTPTASHINVPGGFRRDFVIENGEDEPPTHAYTSLLQTILRGNSSVLYAWVEDGLASDDDSDDEDDMEEQQRYNMVFSSYTRNGLLRRGSDFANDDSVLASNGKTYFTLFKCFVATGVLFIPSGFRNAGLFAGTITIACVGLLSYYGMILLLKTRAFIEAGQPLDATPSTPLLSAEASQAVSQVLFPSKPVIINTFSQLGGKTIGRTGRRVVELSILFSQVGFCCVYISFIGNSLNDLYGHATKHADVVLDETNTTKPFPLWGYMALTIPIITPLTFIRHLKYFSIPNLIANFLVMTSLLYIMIQAIVVIGKHGVATNWDCSSDTVHTACLWINTSTFAMFLGSSVYVFEGITMVIPIQNSMKNKADLPGMLKAVTGSVTLLFCLFGGLSFYAYGQDTKPIIVDNLPMGGKAPVTYMYVLVALFMFPLMIFPAAQIIEKRFFLKMRRSGYKWQKNFIRTCLVIFCVGVSILAGPKVDKLVSIIGGLFCVPLAMIYPPIFFLKSGAAQDFWTEILPATCLMVMGISASCLSSYTAITHFNSD
mmetsp:Transcript_5817/g.10163  ORF Transcript_5817/g.10163 Transcript_5817/m.10163 type:complete len:667 (+) Transcript_5817:72-2072(+)